jgi:hypothetical protein
MYSRSLIDCLAEVAGDAELAGGARPSAFCLGGAGIVDYKLLLWKGKLPTSVSLGVMSLGVIVWPLALYIFL